ncbi:hypothetical protein QR510_30770, partial [Escherichia coli]|uniref:hypothetical protein n=1 Tax=Escherichia coli TaxID=562 RepID=UPI002739A9D1
APAEIKRLVDPLAPPVPRRERELPPQAGVAQPVLSFASPARSRSIPDKTAHTVRVEAPRLSLPGIAALPSLDPLAEPQA